MAGRIWKKYSGRACRRLLEEDKIDVYRSYVRAFPQKSGRRLSGPANLEIGSEVYLMPRDPSSAGKGTALVLKTQGTAQVEANVKSLEIAESPYAICVNAGANLSLRRAKIIPKLGGIYLSPGQSSVDFGTSQDYGNNIIYRVYGPEDCDGELVSDSCIVAPVPGVIVPYRIWNRSQNICNAVGNNWGACVCEDEYFTGSINWEPNTCPTECCAVPGGKGEFSAQSTPSSSVPFAAYPNPANSRISIIYPNRLDGKQPELNIYDLSGRLVRRLGAGTLTANTWSWEWDGKGDKGFDQSSGVYFIRVRKGEKIESKKVILLK